MPPSFAEHGRRPDTTLVGSFTEVARIARIRCVIDALLNTSLDHVRHERVRTQWSRYQMSDTRVLLGCLGRQLWDVFIPVPARQQEIGMYDHQPRALVDTATERRRNRRLGKFHMSRFDNLKRRIRGKPRNDFQ